MTPEFFNYAAAFIFGFIAAAGVFVAVVESEYKTHDEPKQQLPGDIDWYLELEDQKK